MATLATTDTQRLTTELAEIWPRQGQWTETEYFQLPDTNRIVELSEGVLSLMPPPSDLHQKVVANLYRNFYTFVAEHDLGILRFAPLAVRLWPGKIREPDLLLVLHEHADRIGDLVYGSPDLVIEVISPGTRKIDRQDKFYEYAQAGIGEYWLVDPENETIEVYTLEDGVYMLWVSAKQREQATSKLLSGFAIDCQAVFA